MRLFAGALSLIPIWALGNLVQRATRLRRPGPEGLVGDFVVGVLALALLGTIMVGLGWLSVFPVYMLLLLVWSLVRRWEGEGGVPERSEGGAWADRSSSAGRWITTGAALCVILLLSTALTDRLTWDGWAIWTLRARVLFQEGGLPEIVWEKPGPLEFAHPEYPLAVPLLDWWMFRHAGKPAPALASLAGAVWVACVVTLVWSALRERTDLVTAGLAALGVVLFRPISLHAVGGTADIVLTLALLGTAVELRSAVFEGEGSRAWWRASLYLALAALTKNEGTAAAVAAVVAVSLWSALRRYGRPPLAATALFIPVALGFGWQLYVRTMGLDVEQIGGLPPAGELLDRSGLIIREMLRLSVYRSWGPVVGLTILGYVVCGVWRRRQTGPELWLPPIYLCAAIGVYLSTSQDLGWLLNTSLSRVASHALVAALFVALIGLHPSARKPSSWL